jgi:trehalose synthase-fused probable maltokinase
MTPEELRVARWFRSKGRPIAAVDAHDRAPLEDGSALVVLEVRYADGGDSDRYLVPSRDGAEPRDGDGTWRAIVRAMATGAELHGAHGVFRASATPALGELLPSPATAVEALDERRLGVEQSNTSVVLGDRLILKLYRLLEPGDNPDLEIGAFLTAAGFADTPAVAGALTYEDPDHGTATAAMLQAFVPSSGDAWAAMLRALAADPAQATRLAADLGDVTARMHAALASAPDAPGFPARPATTAETAAWRAAGERELAAAVGSVRGEDHDRLVALAPRVTARFADAFGRATGDEVVTRIHGDYHLGQVLARADGGLSVIDFEGEPARPLAERREPSSPLRDVAGMLRSLDYAARTADRGPHAPGFDADTWLAEARAAFLRPVGAVGGLVDAFELAKACYEVRYEANNRPDWLWLPMTAIERLVSGGGTTPRPR